MIAPRQRKSIAFFVTLCVCLCALAAALNVGWIILTWKQALMLVLGILLFLMVIAGLVLNTIFLVREIRRNEQHDAFINAMTHEFEDAAGVDPAISADVTNPAG